MSREYDRRPVPAATRARAPAVPEEHLQHLLPLGGELIPLTGEYRRKPNSARRPGERRALRGRLA